ncbi:alkaline-phosphatase-like protein [Halteromyces radiatus]|uniref:alkaline-phosphatase-like protein n=1 Tax=Halteromyces radiatus TaxID=101107 RepID=UPI00221F0741|nr:alkaline-phosphatase-like protein [Halteromyces radiatus]KAI8085017.1 alkaline-phosphatase-like protein [Halteromyces radiatus]
MSEPLLNSYNLDNDLQNEEELVEWKNTFKSTRYSLLKRFIGLIVSVLLLVLLGMTIALFLTPLKTVEEPTEEFNNNNNSNNNNDTINQPKLRNVIMMISDGLGPASVSFARTYHQYINNLPYDFEMPLDTIHIGQSRTRSSSTLVTDSAAGATAFSCGLKTYNGGVGVDPHGKPCGTLLESAKHHLQMKTGLVATSRITHATPASFSAHVVDRDNENAIATQQMGENPLGVSVDLMFGGGYCHFLPKSVHQSCRRDERHLLEEAKQKFNWTTVTHGDRHFWDDIPVDPSLLPIISLFTPDHMSYEIDREQSKEPSLTEMSDKALQLLSSATKDSDTGFFLMIEGSRIDMAAHSNDPAAHVHEILEYQNTIALVKNFVDQHPDTIMISTSDHETGGLSLARQVSAKYPKYLWYPDVLKNVKRSTAILGTEILHLNKDDRQKKITEQLGIVDITKEEMDTLGKISSKKRMDQYLAEMISIRSQLGWTTHGHSGVDVNLYAYGQNLNDLRGSHENIEIGQFISEKLGLDLDDVTTRLNRADPSFHLTPLTEKGKVDYTNHLDQYHHEASLLHHPAL